MTYDQIVVWVEPERINDYYLKATVYFIKGGEVVVQYDDVLYRSIVATDRKFCIYELEWVEGKDKFGNYKGWSPDFKRPKVMIHRTDVGEIIEHEPYKHLTDAMEELLKRKKEQA